MRTIILREPWILITAKGGYLVRTTTLLASTFPSSSARFVSPLQIIDSCLANYRTNFTCWLCKSTIFLTQRRQHSTKDTWIVLGELTCYSSTMIMKLEWIFDYFSRRDSSSSRTHQNSWGFSHVVAGRRPWFVFIVLLLSSLVRRLSVLLSINNVQKKLWKVHMLMIYKESQAG